MGLMEDWLRQAVATVLERVLGTFIEGIDVENLKLDALGGDVTLSSLRLRLSAFEALDLPLAVADGRLGSVRVKVPWRNLGKEPMLVSIQKLHLLLTPLPAAASGPEAVAQEVASALATKREALAAWESVQERGKDEGISWVDAQVDKLVRSLLQQLEIDITDVHVRVQQRDGDGSLAAGILLPSLRISDLPTSSINMRGASSKQVTEMLAEIVRKSVRVDSLAAYLCTDVRGASSDKIADSADGMSLDSIPSDAYMLSPITCEVAVQLDPRRSPSAASHPPWPRLKLEVSMDGELALSLRHAQLGALLAMVETISRKERRHRFRSCGRPDAPPTRGDGTMRNTHLWWQYARRALTFLASDDSSAVTWLQLVKRRRQRQEYIRTYARYCARGGWKKFHSTKGAAAAPSSDVVLVAMEAMEAKMPIELAIRYRALSRAVSQRLGGQWWDAREPSGAAAAVRAPPKKKAASGERRKEEGGFQLFGLTFGGKKDEGTSREDATPVAAGAADGSTTVVAVDEEESALRQRVRARWSVGGVMSEWELQRLQEDLASGEDAVAGSSDAGQLARSDSGADAADYVSTLIDLLVGRISVTLYTRGDDGLARLRIERINAHLKQRERLSGLGLQAHVGSVSLVDLSTPIPELSHLLSGSHPLTEGQWLSLSLETGRLTAPVEPMRTRWRALNVCVRRAPRRAAALDRGVAPRCPARALETIGQPAVPCFYPCIFASAALSVGGGDCARDGGARSTHQSCRFAAGCGDTLVAATAGARRPLHRRAHGRMDRPTSSTSDSACDFKGCAAPAARRPSNHR